MAEYFEFDFINSPVLQMFIDQQHAPWRGFSLNLFGHTDRNHDVECIPFHSIGSGVVRADRWVGNFTLKGNRYCIKPRIGWSRFVSLIEVSLGLPSVGIIDAATSISKGLELQNNLLALLWCSALRQGRRHHGAPKTFVRREDPDSESLHGKLDLQRQLTSNELGRRHRIACIYDELTYNNPLNQATRAVIRKVKSDKLFPFYSSPLSSNSQRRGELLSWQDRLGLLGVHLPDVFPQDAVKWSRSNAGYRSAHELAKRIVSRKGANLSGAANHISETPFFDAAEVWEIFLLKRLQRVASEMYFRVISPRYHQPFADYLLRHGNITRGKLLPDYLLQKLDGKTIAVIDAKCRHMREEWGRGIFVPQNDEIVQMALYSSHYDMVPAVLLYPRVAPDIDTPKAGFNSNISEEICINTPVGTSHLELKDRPLLSWWAIHIDSPKNREWLSNVDKQLTNVLKACKA